jgi:hypothetical protein
LSLFLCPFFLIEQTQAAIYSAPYGICSIEITNIDVSSKTLTVHLVVEDPTSPIFPDRSSSELVFQYADMPYFAIIWANDFDWQLVGTNSGNASHWKIEKDFEFQYNSTSFYPYEQFSATFYFASNMTHYFNVSPMANYVATVDKELIPSNQFPITQSSYLFSGEGFSDISAQHLFETYKVTINMSSQDVVVQGASMIYGLFVVLAVVALLLVVLFWKNILSFSNSVTIAITTAVLFFLPILLFTFRTSIAPKYSTPVDIGSVLLILLYGVLLCIQLGAKIYRAWKLQKDRYRVV